MRAEEEAGWRRGWVGVGGGINRVLKGVCLRAHGAWQFMAADVKPLNITAVIRWWEVAAGLSSPLVTGYAFKRTMKPA